VAIAGSVLFPCCFPVLLLLFSDPEKIEISRFSQQTHKMTTVRARISCSFPVLCSKTPRDIFFLIFLSGIATLSRR
jgi:hypothetical protein